MTGVPEAPGAPALYLYRQVDRDDQKSQEYNYVRIKVLTEEGRKYANVEIPFVKGGGNIRGIKARTIRPNGSIANFEGKAFDKTVIEAKGLKYLAKTFALPDVQVGSIIEYQYTRELLWEGVFGMRWILSQELFTKRVKFTLKHYGRLGFRYSWPAGLPAGTVEPKEENGEIRLEAQNIPAFQIEDFMPPPDELKYRVEFAYRDSDTEKGPDEFWKKKGKLFDYGVEKFVGNRKTMEQALAEIVLPSDAPEVKLQKIYEKVQKLRNTSWDVKKTEQEQKRAKEKEINNVEDVWKRGYGNGIQINLLFLALARTADFEAYPIYIASRNAYFFESRMMNAAQLNGIVLLVKVNGKDVYCDPSAAFAPLGLLPWAEAGVPGLRLDKEGGSWVTTTLPVSAASRIERKADLRLTETGDLEGKLTVTFVGLEALWRRIEERNEDEVNRKKFLEDQVKEYIPIGSDAALISKPDWGSSTQSLTAEFNLKVPGWVSNAGRRALIPVGLFSGPEKHVFEHANRVHPIYFAYPSSRIDDISIEPPSGWLVNRLPEPQNNDQKICAYSLRVDSIKGTLHVSRRLNIDITMLEAKYYPALRNFYQAVRSADEQQIVLQPLGVSSRN